MNTGGFSAGTTIGWHLGYEGYKIGNEEQVFKLDTLCGNPCSILADVGKVRKGVVMVN